VGPESLNPLDELRGLDQQVDQVADLAGLKPIFYRLDEIAKEHSGDFEVQLAVDDVKQRVVSRGKALREMQRAAPPPPAAESSSAAEPPSARPTPVAPKPVSAPKPTQPRVAPAKSWPQPMIMGAVAGAIIAILLLALLVNQARKRNLTGAGVQLQVATIPAGAAVRIASGQSGEPSASRTARCRCRRAITK